MMSPCLKMPQHFLSPPLMAFCFHFITICIFLPLCKGHAQGCIHFSCLRGALYRTRHIVGAQERSDE